MIRFISFTLFQVLVIRTSANIDPFSDEFIDQINSAQNLWRAGRNFPKDTPAEHLNTLACALRPTRRSDSFPEKTYSPEFIASLPESFDAREKWPNCPTLNRIRDQSTCGDCWAFGAVEAMTDRVCIFSKGAKNFEFSAEDLTSCCGATCGNCSGGYPNLAWEYWAHTGIVSGGNYGSNEGCKPFSVPPRPLGPKDPVIPCKKKCVNGMNYKADRRRGKNLYYVTGEGNIKAELYSNGPGEVHFEVYEDFGHYKDGVYFHNNGSLRAGHAVKLLGWGVENGVKYWLAANSWGTTFGLLGGFFKIRRGVNECNFEDFMMVGEPILDF